MSAKKNSSKKKQKQCDPNHPHCARILLIDSQQRLLLVKELDKELKPKQWNLPGGQIDPGEDAWTAAKRELKEETAVDIMQESKPHDHRFDKNGGGIAYFVYKIEGSPTAQATRRRNGAMSYTGIRTVTIHIELSSSDALYRPVPHAL